MQLNSLVFGINKYQIIDSRLFSTDTTTTKTQKISINDSTINQNNLLTTLCATTTATFAYCGSSWCHSHGDGSCIDMDNCPLGQCYSYSITTTNCITVETPNFPGGGGTGGTGGGNDIPHDYPCIPTAIPTNVTSDPLPPCPPPVGGNGWIPAPPYVCNRTLTQNEQDIFNQLDAEDAADNLLSPLDCKGTKARGNINFTGVKEHWLLQLDYVSKNPTYGEMEYQIPFASSNNPLYRGRADIVNMLSGEMFEIKPENAVGQAAGIAEVATYVNKANTYCTSSLPFGTAWHSGSTYAPVTLPTGTPNKFLTASMVYSGVITYQYIKTSNPPVPVPIIIPSTVLDKFKTLVDRLKDNLADADRIMAEFLVQNPSLTTYIKTAAITAGVAIIVATLLDDMTLVGILDDAAGFMAVYRIVRFALLLP